ncbi:MAG: DEAD/DEAH box helicase [Salinivirgaceae bacterium]|nr:DEAD/DEAH box helicase [Salinivirgaceae bacterium]
MSNFTDFGLNENIIKAISEMGFESPTPIQEKTIPTIIASKTDLVALAQTGTGKTASFGLPLLQQIDLQSDDVQALILCPTRELCLQIANDLTKFAKYTEGVSIVAVYGGANINPQIKQLKSGAHIVVGTPGRVLDVISRGALKINNISWLVLDEADEMLNMGFQEDLDNILSSAPDTKQTLLFSATMPDGVRKIAMNYMHDAEEIAVGKKNSGAENVKHEYYMVKAADRYLALKRLADINPNIYGIVFCRTRIETKEVAAKLIQDGYNADALHGDLSQDQRDTVMNRFRNRSLQLLIATDVAARGLDVNDLTHVINYNLPDDPEVYIHRSGRTGRAGKSGVAMTIVHSREMRKIKELEKLVGKPFELKKVPTGAEICEKRLYNVLDRLERVEVNDDEIAAYLPMATKKLSWLDKDELIKRVVWLEFNRFIDYYKSAEDLNVEPGQGKGKSDGEERKERKERKHRNDEDYTRLFINVGTKRGLSVPRLLGMINDATHDKSIDIGRIDLQRNFSFFEIENEAVEKVMDALKSVMYDNENVEFGLATNQTTPPSAKRVKKKPQAADARSNRDSAKDKGRGKRSNLKIEKKKFNGAVFDETNFNFDFFNDNIERRHGRKAKRNDEPEFMAVPRHKSKKRATAQSDLKKKKDKHQKDKKDKKAKRKFNG